MRAQPQNQRRPGPKGRQAVATSVRAWLLNIFPTVRAPKVRQGLSALRALMDKHPCCFPALTDGAISFWPFGPGFHSSFPHNSSQSSVGSSSEVK
jgi:hypothetical protein